MIGVVWHLRNRPAGITAGQMIEAAEVIEAAEEAIGNNLVWLTDQLDLQVRQGDPETLRRLKELQDVWEKLAHAVAK